MRRLLYVPILHSEADMGSAGAALTQQSTLLTGEQRWQRHQETVDKFWESTKVFLLSFNPHQLWMYQDGLAADGDLGKRIVEEAASRGSRNFQLILELLNRGAGIRKTEDPVLLWREREYILDLAQQGSGAELLQGSRKERQQRDRLLAERDRFIAKAISATLKEGEIGVLFIGAYHDVASRLAADITVQMVKEQIKVQAYFAELLLGQREEQLEELALYLASPVRTA